MPAVLYIWTSKYELAAIAYIPCNTKVELLAAMLVPGYVVTKTFDHVEPLTLYLPIICIKPDVAVDVGAT